MSGLNQNPASLSTGGCYQPYNTHINSGSSINNQKINSTTPPSSSGSGSPPGLSCSCLNVPVMGSPNESPDIWRGTSIASLRRKALEHTATMTAFGRWTYTHLQQTVFFDLINKKKEKSVLVYIIMTLWVNFSWCWKNIAGLIKVTKAIGDQSGHRIFPSISIQLWEKNSLPFYDVNRSSIIIIVTIDLSFHTIPFEVWWLNIHTFTMPLAFFFLYDYPKW